MGGILLELVRGSAVHVEGNKDSCQHTLTRRVDRQSGGGRVGGKTRHENDRGRVLSSKVTEELKVMDVLSIHLDSISTIMAERQAASVQAQLQSQSQAFQKIEAGTSSRLLRTISLLLLPPGMSSRPLILPEMAGIIEARQRLDSQQSENELVLKVRNFVLTR